jgi:hypothetical protein
MFNFNYEDGFKINYKYFPAISRALYLSTETISRPPQFHETIPLKGLYFGAKCYCFSKSCRDSRKRFFQTSEMYIQLHRPKSLSPPVK